MPVRRRNPLRSQYRLMVRALGLIMVLVVFVSCEYLEKAVDFVNSISDGAPCEQHFECLGQRCLTERMGYPGGYCTTFGCDQDGCSGFNSECFRTTIEGQDLTACYELCQFDNSCRRGDEGYDCVILDDTAICMPPNVGGATAQGTVGAPCTNDLQCNDGGTCLTSFFGGYCSILACNPASSCASGNPCVALNPGADEGDRIYGCMDACQSGGDCRFGYACQSYEGVNICLEGDQDRGTRNPDGLDDGEPCVANINCKGGTCIRETESSDGVSFPGGYCTTRSCTDDTACHGESFCVTTQASTACRAVCASTSDCRQGYDCKSSADGRRYCGSSVEITPPDPSGEEFFDVTCGSSKELTFTTPPGSIGFYIAPFTRQNRLIKPRTLRTPSLTFDIESDYAFHAINPYILETLAPILFPASNDTRFATAFVAGTYTLTVQTDATEICYYVIPKMAPGTRLDVNLYFVGVPNITAATAASNNNVQQFVQVMQSIYQSMGVQVNIANYIEPDRSVVEMYSIVRDFNDIFGLVATSQTPGTTRDESLSVNVFLINDFNISEAQGLLGVSAGLPGMAGLHGNSGSGLIFSTASLGRDNASLGQTMAHEIGHFLGLRHTTEHQGSAHDPITDTPTCIYPSLGYLCPDAKNFMFAFSLGSDQRVTTPGQSFVVKRSPLVK